LANLIINAELRDNKKPWNISRFFIGLYVVENYLVIVIFLTVIAFSVLMFAK